MSYSNYQSRKIPGFVQYAADLLRYRHLCWNLVGSDIRSRFRRSYLGILWAVIQPLAYSLLIAWAWGSIFKAANYWEFAVYVFSGMLVWEYFANTLIGSLEGLTGAVGYIRQARIPLFVFQARVPFSGLVTFLCALVGLALMLAALQMLPPIGVHLLLIPAFIGMMVMFMLPVSVIFSVLGAQLRDLKHIMGLAIQALFFLSPVMLSRATLDQPHLAILKYLNPMVPLLDMFRAPVLHGTMWNEQSVIIVCVWGAALWVIAFIVAARAGRRIVFAI